MENYVDGNRIPMLQWIQFCISNFHAQHYEQIRQHRYLTYREFKRKLIDMFRKPDLTQYKIKQLWEIEQATDEEPDAFMNRIRLLTQEAFRKLPDDEQQMLAVNAFCSGLKDRTVATLVATQAKNSMANAVRIACEALTFNNHTRVGADARPRSHKSHKSLLSMHKECPDCHDYSNVESDSELSDSRHRSSSERDYKCLVGEDGQSQFRGRGRPFARRPFVKLRRPATETDASTRCTRCAGYAHTAEFCSLPSYYKDGKIDPQIICRRCNKAGHVQAICKEPPPSDPSTVAPASDLPTVSGSAECSVLIRRAQRDAKRLVTFLSKEFQLNDYDLPSRLNAHAPESALILTQDRATSDYDCVRCARDPVLALCPETSSQPAMFWFLLRIQDKSLWGLADTGSFRNLMSKKFYDSLPVKVRLKSPGYVAILAANGKAVEPLGWGIFEFEIAGKIFCHEVGVVQELPVDFLIGTDLMIPHSAKLRYSSVGSNSLSFEPVHCSVCYANLLLLNEEKFLQLFSHFFLSPEWKNDSLRSESNEPAVDAALPLVYDVCELAIRNLFRVPSLRLNEMIENQKEEIPYYIRDWIENRIIPSTVEEDGFKDTVRTSVAVLHDLHIRAGILDLIDPPLGPFSILNPHAFLANILQSAHPIAANQYRNYRILLILLRNPRSLTLFDGLSNRSLHHFDAPCRTLVIILLARKCLTQMSNRMFRKGLFEPPDSLLVYLTLHCSKTTFDLINQWTAHSGLLAHVVLITSLLDYINTSQITEHAIRLNDISLRLLHELSLFHLRPAILITDTLDSCDRCDNSTFQEPCHQSQFPGHDDILLNIPVMLSDEPSTVPFHSHTFLSNLAKTNLVSDYALASHDYVPFEIIVVKCPLNSHPPNLCNRMSKSTCRMDIRDALLPVLSVGMGEEPSSGVVSQSAPQEACSRIESLTDMHLVAIGSDPGDNITTALKPPIPPFLVSKVRTYLGVPRQKVVNRVDGRGVPFVPTRRGFFYVLEHKLAKALQELVQGLAKLVWGVHRLVRWNRATGSAPSSGGTAKYTLEGALQAETGGMLCSDTLDSMALSSARRTTCRPRVRIRSVANVHSPSGSTATSVRLASGSAILPGFVAEAAGGQGSAILVTAASARGAPTTTAGTVPPPAAAQFPTAGVGLERDQLFEENEEYYGEDLVGAGQGSDADESEMAQEAHEEQSGAGEEEDAEERAKRLHVVESAEKDTTDTDGAAK